MFLRLSHPLENSS